VDLFLPTARESFRNHAWRAFEPSWNFRRPAAAKKSTGEWIYFPSHARGPIRSTAFPVAVPVRVPQPIEALGLLGDPFPELFLGPFLFALGLAGLLAADRVLAICLKGSAAPALPLQKMGTGGNAPELRLGTEKGKMEGILRDEPFEVLQIDRPWVGYRFYPGLGLGVRLKGDRVEELVIAQVPRRPPAGSQ
jgi:hypothetical protein